MVASATRFYCRGITIMYLGKNFPEKKADELIAFLNTALTFANYGAAEPVDLANGSFISSFDDGDWYYEDTWYGGEPFTGITTVSYKSTVCWTMAYRGRLEERYAAIKEEVMNCLKAALKVTPSNRPVRGPELYQHPNDFLYRNQCRGTIADFSGSEEIRDLANRRVYTCTYAGGFVNLW